MEDAAPEENSDVCTLQDEVDEQYPEGQPDQAEDQDYVEYDPDNYEGLQYEPPDNDKNHLEYMRNGYSDNEYHDTVPVLSDEEEYLMAQAWLYAIHEVDNWDTPTEFLTGELEGDMDYLTGSVSGDTDKSEYFLASSQAGLDTSTLR